VTISDAGKGPAASMIGDALQWMLGPPTTCAASRKRPRTWATPPAASSRHSCCTKAAPVAGGLGPEAGGNRQGHAPKPARVDFMLGGGGDRHACTEMGTYPVMMAMTATIQDNRWHIDRDGRRSRATTSDASLQRQPDLGDSFIPTFSSPRAETRISVGVPSS